MRARRFVRWTGKPMSFEKVYCRLILSACVLGVPSLAATAEDAAGAAANLLANTRFEEVDANGAPVAWEAACDGASIDAKLTVDAGPEGSRAVKLQCTRLADAAHSSHGMLAQRGKIRFEAGRWYRLTFWARQRGIVGGGVNIAIYRMRDFINCGLNVTTRLARDWRRYDFVFQASLDPGETGRFQIWYGESGTLWIADPMLAPCNAPQLKYSPALPPAPGKNLVPNGSFEAGAGGWGSTADLSGWGTRGLDFRFGEVDHDVAYDGKASLKIAVNPQNAPVFFFDYYEPRRQPVWAPLLANEGWIAVEPGKPYTLSAMMKADRPGVVARMGLRTMQGKRTQNVTLSCEWQRYSVRLTPQEPCVYVKLGPDLNASKMDAAATWIDAVQLEAGKGATPFVSYSPVEVGFETGRVGNLFDGGEPIIVRATASNRGAEEAAVTITWRATDFFDEPAGKGNLALKLPAGGRKEEAIPTGITRPGFFRLSLTAESGGHTLTREMRAASIERVPPGDSHVGMNHAYGWPHLLDLCDYTGLRWMRDWSIKWQHVQPKPGPFDFSATDYQFDRVLDRKLPLLALLPYSANDWAADLPAGFEKLPRGALEAGRASLPPKDPAAFGAYVAAAVEHYGKRVKHWEVLNEPLYTSYTLPSGLGYKAEDYVRVLKAGYAAAKKADPHCTVIGGIGGHPLLYMRQLFAAGGLQHMDALNLHLYPVGTSPEAYEPQLAQLRRMLRAAGRPELPIWVTECGMYADDDDPVSPAFHWNAVLGSERQCSEYLVRFAAITLGFGVEKLFYHYGAAGTINQENPESIFFEYAGTPRKMLPAQAVFCRLVPGSRRILKIADLHPQARTYLFGDSHVKVMLAWVPDAGDRLSLRLASPRLSAVDIMGAPIRERTISLGEAPIYITGLASMSVGEFVAAVRVGE